MAISPRTGKIDRTFVKFYEATLPIKADATHGTAPGAVTSRNGLIEAERTCQISSLDRTGQHALTNCGGLHRLDNGKFTNLPNRHGKFGPQVIAAAW